MLRTLRRGKRLTSDLINRVAVALLRRLRLGDPRCQPAVVLFKPDGIGDFVLATGLIHFWLKLYADRRVVLVVADYVGPLARREMAGCEVCAVPFVGDHFRGGLVGGFLGARKLLRRVNPALLVSARCHVLLYQDLLLGGLRAPVSYGCNPATSLAAHRPYLVRFCRFRPVHQFDYPAPDERTVGCPAELQAHLRLATLLAGRPVQLEEIAPRLESFQVSNNAALLVLPITSSSALKHYPAPLLAEAIAAARLPPRTAVRVCAQPAVRARLNTVAQAIAARDPGLAVEVVATPTTAGLAEEVAAAGCVLTMDSAGAHLATALDKPAVVILGGGHFGLFAPWTRSRRQHWLWQQMDCFGCRWACRYPEPLCITQIPAARVAASIRELLPHL